MYEELVMQLRELHPEEFGDKWDFAFACQQAMNEAADAIEQLSHAGSAYGRGWTFGYDAGREESKLQWIPVTERLPEEKTYVLILVDAIAGKMEKVSFLYKDSESRNCWTTLDEYGKNLFDWQPTHWMPLPEPPKEE